MDVTPGRFGTSVVSIMVVGLVSRHIPEKGGFRWSRV
jgi:hypothetical protein